MDFNKCEVFFLSLTFGNCKLLAGETIDVKTLTLERDWQIQRTERKLDCESEGEKSDEEDGSGGQVTELLGSYCKDVDIVLRRPATDS